MDLSRERGNGQPSYEQIWALYSEAYKALDDIVAFYELNEHRKQPQNLLDTPLGHKALHNAFQVIKSHKEITGDTRE